MPPQRVEGSFLYRKGKQGSKYPSFWSGRAGPRNLNSLFAGGPSLSISFETETREAMTWLRTGLWF